MDNRLVLFTENELENLQRKHGHKFHKLCGKRISWQRKDIKSMVSAQLLINETILTKKLDSKEIASLKSIMRELTEDMKAFYTSTCSVCGNKKSYLEHGCGITEHITIKESWGYASLYDGDTHKLVLCCECYRDYIMDGPLGKFVQRKEYM